MSSDVVFIGLAYGQVQCYGWAYGSNNILKNLQMAFHLLVITVSILFLLRPLVEEADREPVGRLRRGNRRRRQRVRLVDIHGRRLFEEQTPGQQHVRFWKLQHQRHQNLQQRHRLWQRHLCIRCWADQQRQRFISGKFDHGLWI